MATTVNSYMKNLAKSLGYISLDVINSYAPVMTSLTKSAKESTSDMYHSIKDFTDKGNTSDFSFSSMRSKAGEVASNVWKNTIDDLKTGKIYNKERSDALSDEIASGFLGEDFNFDFSFDDDDWGDDDESSSDDGAKAQVAAQMESSKAVISAVDAVGRGISASFTEASVQSASYIAESAREDTQALYNLNREGFGTLTKALASVNETIYNFSKIGEPLTAHMQNSTIFFSKTSESLNNIEQTLKQIEKNTTPAPVAGSKGYKTKKSLGSFMSDDEGIDFAGLRDSMKESINEYKELISFFTDMVKPVGKSGGKNITLLGSLATMGVKKIIPKAISQAIKDLDESVKYGLGAGLNKVAGKGTGNPLIDTLLGMVLPGKDMKRTLSANAYEQGAVQWDGVARKALTDVIPTTLLEIYAAITGTEPMRFDYKSGKYVKTSSILGNFKKDKQKYVEDAGGDIYKEIKKRISEDKNSSKDDKEKMMKNLYLYFENMFDDESNDVSFAKDRGIDEKTLAMIQNTVREVRAGGSKGRKAVGNKLSVDMAKAAESYANNLREIEASGFSQYQALHDEFGKLSGKGKKGDKTTIIGLDEYGHNYYYYLQGIWQYTGYLANNIGSFGSSDRHRKRNNAPNINSNGLPKIEEVIEEQAGERTTSEANQVIFGGDFDEDKEHQKEIEENTNKIKDWFRSKFKGKLGTKIIDKLDTNLDPLSVGVAGIINSISSTIDNLIFGTEDNPESGIFSYAFDKMKDLFDKAKDWFKEKIVDKIKNWFNDKVKDKWDGSSTKETLTNIGKKVKGRVKEVFIGRDRYADNGTAAYGKQVTKTGTVVVSEGEMILPSELNPFYHGATNKAAQRNNEAKIAGGRYPTFADGYNGFVMYDKDSEKLYKSDEKAKSARMSDRYDMSNSILGLLSRAASNAFAKTKQVLDDSIDEKKLEEDKKKISNKIADMLGEVGGAKGEIGAGAILGAGASILTGAVIGPIAGAALGAGIGFIYKSKAAQDFIFGPEDEDGKRKHQKAYDFFKKELPNVGIGASLGAAAGLFMGSPVLGAFIGGAAGFMTSSDSFKKWLFGEKDQDDGAIPKSIQEKIKKALPAVVAGGVLGAVAGPFGIVGNILLGSSLGFSASVGRLNESLFGGDNVKREESLVFIVKEKIFGGIDNIFHNMNNRFKIWSKELAKHIRDKLSDKINKMKLDAKEGKGGIGTRLLGGFFNASDWLLDKTVKVPVKAIAGLTEKIDNKIAKTNLKKGYGTWNRKENRNMTAQERMNARMDLGVKLKGKDFEKFDDFLNSIKDFTELNKFKDLIYTIKTENPGSAAYEAAVDELINSDKWKEYMKDTSVDFIKKNINRLSGLVDDESKRKGLSKEETETNWNKDNHDNISSILENLKNGVRVFIDNIGSKNKGDQTGNLEDEEKKINSKDIIDDATNNSKELGKYLGPSNKSNDESGEDNTVDTITPFGIIEAERGKDGGLSISNKDRETQGTMGRISSLFNAIKSMPSLIGNKMGKLFGVGEDANDNKENLLSKAKNFIKKVLSKAKNFIKEILLPIGIGVVSIVAAVKGLFGGQNSGTNAVINSVGAAVGLGGNPSENSEETNGGPNDNGGVKTQFQTKDGKIVYARYNSKGQKEYVDSDGNPVDASEISRNQAGQKTVIDNYREGTVRQLVTGKPTAAGAVIKFGTSQIARGVSKIPVIGEKIIEKSGKIGNTLKGIKTTLLTEAPTEVGALAETSVYVRVSDALESILTHIDDLPIPAGLKSALPDCFDDIAETCAKNAGKLAENTAKFAQNLADIVPVLNVIMMVVDFHTGYEDARTTLGITAKPTVPQRMVSGLLRLLKNLIPFIGPLIPDDLIINILCKYVAPVFGLSDSELMKQREEAKIEVAQYNAEHGTDYDVAEYNKAVLNDYTLTERYGNLFKTTFQQAKDKVVNTSAAFKNAGGGLKGISAAFNEFVGVDEVKQTYKDAGGGIHGFVEATKEVFENIGPGMFGELGSKTIEMYQCTFNGDIKGLMNVGFDAFTKTNENQADVNILTQTIGNTLFNTMRILLLPLAAMSKGIRKLIELGKPVIDGAKKLATSGFEALGITNAIESIKEGNIEKLMSFSSADDNDNGLIAGIKTVTSVPIKIVTAVPTLISAAGHAIWNKIVSPIIDKVKETGSNFKQGFTDSFNAEITGDFSNIEDFREVEDDEGNPLSGFQKAVLAGGRITGVIFGMVAKVGNTIKEKVTELVDRVKTNSVQLFKMEKQLFTTASSGSVTDLWDLEPEFDEGWELSGFGRGILVAQKLLLTPMALTIKAGKAIVETVKEKVSRIKDCFLTVRKTNNEVTAAAFSGDVSAVWSQEILEEDEDNPVGGFANAIIFTNRVLSTPVALLVGAGKTVVEKVKGVVSVIKTSFTNFTTAIKDAFIAEITGDFSNIEDITEMEDEEGNPISGYQMALIGVGRILGTVFGMVAKVGYVVVEKVKEIAGKVKNSVVSLGKTSVDLLKSSITGDPAAMWSQQIEQADPDNPVGGFTQGILVAEKVLLTPLSAITWVGRKAIVEPLMKTVQLIKLSIQTIKTRASSLMNYVKAGDAEGLWNDQMQDQDGNPVSGLVKGIDIATKVVMYPMAQISHVGHIIYDKVINIRDTIVNTVTAISDNQTVIHEYAAAGDLEGLWNAETNFEDSPISGVAGAITIGMKVVNTPMAAMHWTGNKIYEIFEKIKEPIVASVETLSTAVETAQDYVDKGDVSGLWSMEPNYPENSPLSPIFGAITTATKVISTPITTIHWVGNKISDFFKGLTSSISSNMDAMKSYKESLDKYAADGKVKEINKLEFKGSSGAMGGIFSFAANFLKMGSYLSAGFNWIGDSLKNIASNVKDKLKDKLKDNDLFKALFGEETAETNNNSSGSSKKKKKDENGGGASGLAVNTSGSASNYSDGFQSQLDPRYKDISFAGSTVGNAGCGPAVATMASQMSGGKLDMNTAIDKARSYTNSNGTSASYFEDVLNAKPVKNTNSVKTALENGRPVILLGKDNSNNSKSKSPFGPNNHYVLATGMKNGKVLVNDPESNGPRVYDQSILNKSSYNLTYGGSSNKRGKGFTDTENAQQIWAYLTKKLGFSEAGAAGLMGCWQNESSNNPNTIEGYYLPGYPGDDAVHTSEGLDNYTTGVLFPAYAASGISINKEAYKGTDGHYYPGFGLAQWTGPRGKALHDYESTSGKAWYTLDNQMQFIGNELSTSYSGYLSKAKSATDVNQATTDAYYDFEGGTRSDWLVQRKADAADIYTTYTGKSYDWQGGGDDASGDSSSDSSDSSSSDGGLLSTLSSIFGSLSSIFDIKNGFSLNSSGSSSSSSSSGGVSNAKGAAAAAQAAQNEIGYAEQGENITKFGKWSGCDGLPWCAAFSAWSIAQAFDGEKPSAVKAIYDCPNVNNCPTLEATYKSANQWYDEPEVGDEVLYSNGSETTHVGLVTSVDKSAQTFESTEGNSQNQVRKITHTSYKDGSANHHVIGFGRPDYTGANATIADSGNDKDSNSMASDSGYSATGSGLRGGSSGLLRKAAPSRYAYGALKGQKFKFGGSSGLVSKNRFGKGSDITKTTTNILTKLKSNLTGGLRNNGNTGKNYTGIDPVLVTELLSAITTLLNSIANNTAPTEKIYNALVEYIDYVKEGDNKSSNKSTEQQRIPTNNSQVDNNLANLVTTLAAIARG